MSWRLLPLALVLPLLTGCPSDKSDEDDDDDDVVDDTGDGWDEDTGDVSAPDEDGDGYPAAEDCDDADAAVHPGAAEVCNGLDDDCNGLVDDDPVDAAT